MRPISRVQKSSPKEQPTTRIPQKSSPQTAFRDVLHFLNRSAIFRALFPKSPLSFSRRDPRSISDFPRSHLITPHLITSHAHTSSPHTSQLTSHVFIFQSLRMYARNFLVFVFLNPQLTRRWPRAQSALQFRLEALPRETLQPCLRPCECVL